MLKKPEADVMEESVAAGYVKPMMDSDIEKVEVGQGESAKQGELSESKPSTEDSNVERRPAESEEEEVGSEHDSVITVRSNDRQRTLVDIGKSVKAVIGKLHILVPYNH